MATVEQTNKVLQAFHSGLAAGLTGEASRMVPRTTTGWEPIQMWKQAYDMAFSLRLAGIKVSLGPDGTIQVGGTND